MFWKKTAIQWRVLWNENLNEQIAESFAEFKAGRTKPINKLISELKKIKK